MSRDDNEFGSSGKHKCHANGCRSECPPRFLMCPSHWDKVPRTLQAEVFNTVNARHKMIDGSWAPWWRAQAKAIAHVWLLETKNQTLVDRYLRKEFEFADSLERKQRMRDLQ